MRKITGAITLKGVGGQLSVDDHFLTIHRKGVNAKMTQGLKGEKRIALKNITAVQLKKPGLTNGYIQFSVAGGNESTRGLFAATKDENSVMFTSRQAEDAYAIRNYIEYYIVHGHAPTEVDTEDEAPAERPAPAAQMPAPPALPQPGPATSIPLGWHADPYQRHHYRYYDGVMWTEHVSDQGVASIDNPRAAPPPPPPPS